jgi:NAD(P)-dependent dehydrogenase (short-subunit alcohol dehydrogenase family)
MTVSTPITTPFGATSTAAEVLDGVDLAGRRIIVTGGASGIGIETARALAGAGAEVTLAVRDLAAGERAAEDITASTGNKQVLVGRLDLADQGSVAEFAAAWDGPLHVLVDKAGIMASPLMRTPQGWEMQFATNHLGTSRWPAGCTRRWPRRERRAGLASSRSARPRTCAPWWSSRTSTSSTGPTTRGPRMARPRRPTCCSRWRLRSAGRGTASPPTRCTRAGSGPGCSVTSPRLTSTGCAASPPTRSRPGRHRSLEDTGAGRRDLGAAGRLAAARWGGRPVLRGLQRGRAEPAGQPSRGGRLRAGPSGRGPALAGLGGHAGRPTQLS